MHRFALVPSPGLAVRSGAARGRTAGREHASAIIKRKFGDALRSILPKRREQEMLLRTLTHNVMLYANRHG